MKKTRTKAVETPTEETVEETPNLARCMEWCFLPGLSHIGQHGLLQCTLAEYHDGEPHNININILNPPSGSFTITWTTGI
jgi:hypothetical protein